MPEVIHDSQITANTSPTDMHKDQKQRSFIDLLLQSNNLLRAVFLELSAILLVGHLFYRLGNSWEGLQSISEGFWIAGAITGGLVGLYVIFVIYNPSMIQRL
jgi:hypothetical protein